MKDVTDDVQVAVDVQIAVLYDISYLVQYLRDIKAKFISPVDCRCLIKQNGNKLILDAFTVLRVKLHV